MTDVDHARQMEALRIALSRDLVRLTNRVAEVVERIVTRTGEAPCERPIEQEEFVDT